MISKWRVEIVESCHCARKFFGGRGVGKSAGSTHSNGHTRLLPCATYYYNYYYISIIVTLFTQRYHEKSGKLGSNCIKVPNSETYNTLWLINNLNIFGKKLKNKKVKYPRCCQFECVGHTDYHNVAAYCTLHYINTMIKMWSIDERMLLCPLHYKCHIGPSVDMKKCSEW